MKQDNEECRIMYREGPAGTRFHVLLAEGYLDGPLDASKLPCKIPVKSIVKKIYVKYA